MKKLVLLCTLCVLSIAGMAQFEGTVDFVKSKGKLTVNYKYKVKDGKVRVEEYGNDNSLDGIQLVDTKEEKIYALSPERRMYMEATNKRPQRTASIEVTKTKSKKNINGKSCEKWIVTNTEQDRKVIYWVTKGDYDFFIPFLKTLNRAEKTAIYFLMIEDNEGCFPVLAEEMNGSGLLISKLEAMSLESKQISSSEFEIPSGYKKFER